MAVDKSSPGFGQRVAVARGVRLDEFHALALAQADHYRSLPLAGSEHIGWALLYTAGPNSLMYGERWNSLAEREQLSSWVTTVGAERAIWAEWAVGPSPHLGDYRGACPTAVALRRPVSEGEPTLTVNAAWPAHGYLYSWVGDPANLDEHGSPRFLRSYHEEGEVPIVGSLRARALAHAGSKWLTEALVSRNVERGLSLAG